MNNKLKNDDIYTFRVKRNNKVKQSTVYFPDEVFQIIKDYIGIIGLTNEQFKLFNTVGIKTLQYMYNETFNVNIKLDFKEPAHSNRRFILSLLFTRVGRNRFEKMYNIYITDVRDFWINNNKIIVGDEYRLCSKQQNQKDIFGVITKITKNGVMIKPFAYHYEIIDIIDKKAIKIFHFNRDELLPPIRFNVNNFSAIQGYIKITDANRSRNYCYRLKTYEIPENEQHLIRYT